ncbi:MAG: hypothetical protein AB4352_19850 [Hormoscilla sp.]
MMTGGSTVCHLLLWEAIASHNLLVPRFYLGTHSRGSASRVGGSRYTGNYVIAASNWRQSLNRT